MGQKINFTIQQGETWEQIIRWEQASFVYKQITNISVAAPVRITAPGHELLEGWRFAVSNVVGMVEINAKSEPPDDSEYHVAKIIDTDIVEINALNGIGFKPRTSGGIIRYRPPEDLSVYTGARMHLRRNARAASPYFALTTEDGQIVIDNAAKTITLRLSDEETEAFTFTKAYYDLEMLRGGDVVIPMSGIVTVSKNMTK